MPDSPERTGAAPPAQPPPAAAGPDASLIQITDPRTLRALAHPARMEILMFLGLEGPATATECAEVTGLSPSACSYHLRALARHGFVAEDLASAADGRQRPWRALILGFNIPDSPETSPATRIAGRLIEQTLRAQGEQLRQRYLERQPAYPAPWPEALGHLTDVLHVTPDELITMRTRLIELLGEYRRLDRDARPPGAGRVRVQVDLIPWFEPGAAAAAP
jgi:DNA-binding transcriptional ArsR family regulator